MVAKRRIRIVDDGLETGSKETSAKIFLGSYKRIWWIQSMLDYWEVDLVFNHM